MNCCITIPGDGRGRYGHPVHDRTGPIREFLVDNAVFYKYVYRHVKTCDKCNAAEILNHYLERRISNPKFKGVVSDTLMKNAFKYNWKKDLEIRKVVVKMALRCMSSMIYEKAEIFTELETAQWAQNYTSHFKFRLGLPNLMLALNLNQNLIHELSNLDGELLANFSLHSDADLVELRKLAAVSQMMGS